MPDFASTIIASYAATVLSCACHGNDIMQVRLFGSDSHLVQRAEEAVMAGLQQLCAAAAGDGHSKQVRRGTGH